VLFGLFEVVMLIFVVLWKMLRILFGDTRRYNIGKKYVSFWIT